MCKNNISTQISHSTELTQSHTSDSSFTSKTSQIKHDLDSNSSNKTSSHDIPKHLWNKRYLFEKFDDGILLDYESFYSVYLEILSKYIAKRCEGYNVAMDPFCGYGGNVIQLVMKYKKVIAIDIDPIKLEFAKKNAEIYGVRNKIEFIVGDFFTLAKDVKKYKVEVIVTTPPWGGPLYKNHKTYSLEKNMCSEYEGGGRTIFELARSIAPNVALHIPKSTDRNEFPPKLP
ncbi:trimethylguanosine synthase-like [Daktulosphaira vitifoliae]|uniref:trimethylguanosine synthase-like n=1 Tax=Daktulosphaira vitifoliae TaxID=58002 RepID=UPI0021AAC884|nr:trimethylguanosine synthase-like [Daktulosphaira vitifoliae]